MKTPSMPLSLAGAAVLLVLFAAGGLVLRALALPLPLLVAGAGFALLGLRIAVMLAAVAESPGTPARPLGPRADARGPALRAANG